MEIIHIKYFIEAAHQMHFALAARTLGVSQPALSLGIRALEKELGFELFDCHNKRKIFLTEAGKTFLKETEPLLPQLKNAQRHALAAANGHSGHLAIGALSSALGRQEVLDTLVEMQRLYPDVTLEVIDDNSRGLSTRILEHSLDLALTRYDQPLFETPDIHYEQIYMDELLVVLRHDHPLNDRQPLKLSDLADEQIILVPLMTSPAFHEFVRNLCIVKGGFIPKVMDESSSSYTALRLVQAGLGICFVPMAYNGMFSESLRFHSLPDVDAALPVYAVRQRDRQSPVLQNFMALLRRNMTERRE